MSIPTLAQLKSSKRQIEEIASLYGVSNVRIFGSVVHGNATETSDIDLLVDFDKPTFRNYFYFKEAVTELLKTPVDVVDASSIDNKLRREYIFRDAVIL